MDKRRIAREFAEKLTVGAYEGGTLEVRRLILSRNERNNWEPRRFTLTKQLEDGGAFAGVLQENGRRWVYTTTQGRIPLRTIERWTKTPIKVFKADTRSELAQLLEEDLMEALREATHDLRAIRCSIRPPGFDLEWALREWRDDERFTAVLDGTSAERVSDDELFFFLIWYVEQVPEIVRRFTGGNPVSEELFTRVQRQPNVEELMEAFQLVRVEDHGEGFAG